MEAVLKTAFPFVVILAGIGAAFGGVMMIVAYTVLAEVEPILVRMRTWRYCFWYQPDDNFND